LIDQLGLHCLHAHQIATRAEEAAVRAAGLEWRYYDRFMQKLVKRIGDERLSNVPRDLDTKPYRDEHDDDLLRRMLACVDKGEVPKGFRRQQLKDAVSTIRQYLRRHATQGTHRTEAVRGKVPPNARRPAEARQSHRKTCLLGGTEAAPARFPVFISCDLAAHPFDSPAGSLWLPYAPQRGCQAVALCRSAAQ
jgi:hypothetical protein